MNHCDEMCCNHGCTEAHDCPARVAKVGQRYPAILQPLPPLTWRDYLKDLARAMLLVVLVMLATSLVFLFVL
jgi:hypothetical protein